MSENKTPSEDEISDHSDVGLQIVTDSPQCKKKREIVFDEDEMKMIESLEKELEENLEKTAEKTNLNAINIKNILKQVITNEDVLALVRHVENPDENIPFLYEPKYTRAKTKELLSINYAPASVVVPWGPPTVPSSEVQKLFGEDLQEDSSGDEYFPDGFDIDKVIQDKYDEQLQNSPKENIALRTRSKLSLNTTALETIEESLIPPDITTDMYDMDCDDDVWAEFLKTFSKPMDDLNKTLEDEEQDPEYNILDDELMDKVDKEELRADKAVTVSRKEFNHLIAELFEYGCNVNYSKKTTEVIEPEDTYDLDNVQDNVVSSTHILLFEQQLRQHVQMLTQTFLLTYQHPIFSHMAPICKELLGNLNDLVYGEGFGFYSISNLQDAIVFIQEWEKLFNGNSKEVEETKLYTARVLSESIKARKEGSLHSVTFPPLILNTVLNSKVFLYPDLLPRSPFKSPLALPSVYYFTNSENHVLAHFLEVAIPQLLEDSFHVTKFGKVRMADLCEYIHRFLMTTVPPKTIQYHLQSRNRATCPNNPIKYYYRYKRAPSTRHCVTPVDDVCPCDRNPMLLPYTWRKHLLSLKQNKEDTTVRLNESILKETTNVSHVKSKEDTAPLKNSFVKEKTKLSAVKSNCKRKPVVPPVIIDNSERFYGRRLLLTPLIIIKPKLSVLILNSTTDDMFPDMPTLGVTPVKETTEDETIAMNIQQVEQNTTVKRNFESVSEFSSQTKDDQDDIDKLMKASSTVKNVTKNQPSGAEKKKTKLKREFLANLSMATPEDAETKENRENDFASEYFLKLEETIEPYEYDQILEVMNSFSETEIIADFTPFYNEIQSILLPKYEELANEFLLFLTNIQAHKIGRLLPQLVMQNMQTFVKKVQLYFKDQPIQMKKLVKCLDEVASNPNIEIELLKSSMLPLFKGNQTLTDMFREIFLSEPPPSLLNNGPYEIVDLSKELTRPSNEDIFETIVVPDTEDMYGGHNCICSCHASESPQLSPRNQHCVKCGLKFIQGKVYMQMNKMLCPVEVSFITHPEKDHFKRLNAADRKRTDTSPSKQVTSPTKENHSLEEGKNGNEDECDGDGSKKKLKGASKRASNQSSSESDKSNALTTKASVRVKTEVSKSDRNSPKKPRTKNISKPKSNVGLNSGNRKRPAEEPLEAEVTEISEPEIVPNNDSDEGNASSLHTDSEEAWTREEDKIILQTFRQNSDNDFTFKHLSEALDKRTVAEIKNRFKKLMSLLKEMTPKK